jgi:hypothetical protein
VRILAAEQILPHEKTRRREPTDILAEMRCLCRSPGSISRQEPGWAHGKSLSAVFGLFPLAGIGFGGTTQLLAIRLTHV